MRLSGKWREEATIPQASLINRSNRECVFHAWAFRVENVENGMAQDGPGIRISHGPRRTDTANGNPTGNIGTGENTITIAM